MKDASKQSKLVTSVCDEGETVASSRENEEIDLHIMVTDVLEARYARHELVNGYPALSTLHHPQLGQQSRFVCIAASLLV